MEIRTLVKCQEKVSGVSILIIQKPDKCQVEHGFLGNGYHVNFAQTIRQAKDLIDRTLFDILILDLDFPEYQGVDGLKYLFAQDISLPIIVILPDDRDDLGADAMHYGAQDYLLAEDLFNIKLMKRILRYSIERNNNILALKKKESQLNHAQEIAKMGTWIWYLGNNSLEPSQAFYGIFEMDSGDKQISIVDFYKCIDSHDRQRIKKELEGHGRLFQSFSTEFQIKTKSNFIKHVLLNGEHLKDSDDSKSRFYGTIQDITELKNKAEIISQKDRFLELSGEIASIGGWELNLITEKLYWSEASYLIHGVSKDFVVSMNSALSLYQQEYVPYLKKMYTEAILNQKPLFMEVPIEKNGETAWLQYIGKIVFDGSKPVKISGIVQDVTIQKKQSEKIRVRAMMLNNIGEAVLAVNSEWKVIFWNSAAEILLGYTREEVIGKPIGKLGLLYILDEEVERVVGILKEGKSSTGEYEITAKDGKKFLALASNSAVTGKDGSVEALVTIIRDISKEKDSLQKLKESEKRFRKLFEHSPVGTGLVDLKTKLWIDSNERLLKLLGYSRKEFMKLSYIDITPQEYRDIDIEHGKQYYKKGSFGPYQKEYFKKDGSRVKVILTGFALGDNIDDMKVWTHVLDITELDEKTESLRQSEERFRDYVENATDVIFTIDHNGIVTYISPNVETILGYHYSDLRDNSIVEHVHPEDQLRIYETLSLGSLKLNKKISFTVRFRNKAGNYVWMQSEGIMRKAPNGKLYGINVARDIDKERKADLRIREQNRILKNIAFVQSHVLRRPLANILGLLELNKLSENGQNDSVCIYDLIKKEAESMDEIVVEIVEKSTALNKLSDNEQYEKT